MANVKMTNKEMFVKVLSVIAVADIAEDERAMLTDFINSRIEQIDKKASTVSKAEKAKAELNATIANEIIAGLTAMDKPVKVSELIKGYEPLSGYSTQKLTPILSTLVTDGKITKSVVKRETFYALT